MKNPEILKLTNKILAENGFCFPSELTPQLRVMAPKLVKAGYAAAQSDSHEALKAAKEFFTDFIHDIDLCIEGAKILGNKDAYFTTGLNSKFIESARAALALIDKAQGGK